MFKVSVAALAVGLLLSSKIAFESRITGRGIYNPEIFFTNPDGDGVKQLTDNDALGFSTGLSPDGTRIASMSDRDGSEEI